MCHLFMLNYSVYLSKCIEIPVFFLPAWFLRVMALYPMLRAVKGSIIGGYIAMENGFCFNLSGGYHHASRKRGGGFCIYPDITLSIHYVRKFYKEKAKKVMIIDLDAH